MIIIETKSVSLQCLFGRKKEVSEDFFLINMKSTKSGQYISEFILGLKSGTELFATLHSYI